MVAKKSRHVRDDSDLLLGLYSQSMTDTASVRNLSNPLYSSTNGASESSPLKRTLNFFARSPSNGEGGGDGESDRPKVQIKKKRYRVHSVSYAAHNHVQVLFRMHGSAFPNVLPFCIVNLIWILMVASLREKQVCDLTFHSSAFSLSVDPKSRMIASWIIDDTCP